jgi:hypothetical protein
MTPQFTALWKILAENRCERICDTARANTGLRQPAQLLVQYPDKAGNEGSWESAPAAVNPDPTAMTDKEQLEADPLDGSRISRLN